jgi:hypothetical protein
MNEKIEHLLNHLPADFWGSVEIHFADGVAKYVKTVQTTQLTNHTPQSARLENAARDNRNSTLPRK